MNNYLGVEGITNKEPGPHYINWIELLSWSMGTARGSVTSASAKQGNVQQVSEIRILISGNSTYLPTLMDAALKAKHFSLVELVTNVEHAPDPNHPGEYMKMTMRDVIFTTAQLSGGGERSTANFTLNFAEHVTNYRIAAEPEDGMVQPQFSRWRTPGVK